MKIKCIIIDHFCKTKCPHAKKAITGFFTMAGSTACQNCEHHKSMEGDIIDYGAEKEYDPQSMAEGCPILKESK